MEPVRTNLPGADRRFSSALTPAGKSRRISRRECSGVEVIEVDDGNVRLLCQLPEQDRLADGPGAREHHHREPGQPRPQRLAQPTLDDAGQPLRHRASLRLFLFFRHRRYLLPKLSPSRAAVASVLIGRRQRGGSPASGGSSAGVSSDQGSLAGALARQSSVRCRAGAGRMGTRTRNTVSPGRESMVIVPAWRSTTIRRAMSRPRPVPLPTSLVV